MSKLTLSFKGMALKDIPLAEGEMFIGSDPGCAIHIDSLAVHPKHAVVLTRGDVTVLRDLGSPEGTFVNDEKVSDRQLKNKDEIRVGKHTLTFGPGPAAPGAKSPAQAARASMAPKPDASPAPEVSLEEFTAQAKQRSGWLQIMTGHNLGKNINLNRSLTNLGTPGIQTAIIAKRNDGYFLSHLEGEHTPRVGDVPIGDKSWHLQDGDIIQIGNVKMQFYYQ